MEIIKNVYQLDCSENSHIFLIKSTEMKKEIHNPKTILLEMSFFLNITKQIETRIPTTMKIRPATKMELDASATEITLEAL